MEDDETCIVPSTARKCIEQPRIEIAAKTGQPIGNLSQIFSECTLGAEDHVSDRCDESSIGLSDPDQSSRPAGDRT